MKTQKLIDKWILNWNQLIKLYNIYIYVFNVSRENPNQTNEKLESKRSNGPPDAKEVTVHNPVLREAFVIHKET